MNATAQLLLGRKVAGESSSRVPADRSTGTALECAVLLSDAATSSKCVICDDRRLHVI